MPAPVSDDAFARAAHEMGAATSEHIQAARQLQGTRAQQGVQLSLAEALVQQGVLTPTLKDSIEKRLLAPAGGTPQQLGNYKLLRKLGEGGMGAVYLAEDTMLARQVAIKILPRKFTDHPDFLARFRREARAAGKLNHPNIVAAFAVDEELGQNYYVMEYCEGESLDAQLKRLKYLPESQVIEIAIQVCGAMKYSHEHGFIHRDIKPANIFLTRDGIAKVLDLGLSKNVADTEQSFQTVSGVALGTPHYISPEQAKGAKDLDGRTDIYSLGATLYHLLTGQTPFSAETAAAVMVKQITEQLPDPRDIRADLSQGIVHIITKAMAKLPAKRYANMGEMLADLELVKAGQAPGSAVLEAVHSSIAMRPAAASPAQPRTGTRGTRQHTSVGRESVQERRAGRDRRAQDLSEPVAQAPSGRVYLIVGGALAGVMLVVGLILAFGGGGTPQAAPKTRPDSGGQPKPVAAQPALPEPLPEAKTPDLPRPQPPAGFGTTGTSPAAADDPARWKNAINLLPLIDPQRDRVSGAWTVTNGILSNSEGGLVAIRVPYRPPDEYDCRVTISSVQVTPTVGVILATQGRDLNWALFSGRAGFEMVDGRDLSSNPTCRETGGWPKSREPGTLTIQVRRGGLKTWHDGRFMLEFSTDYSNVQAHRQWNLGEKGILGLGVMGEVSFHRLEILEVSGKGTFTRPNDPAAREADRKRSQSR